jgi:hypothetical protein
LQQIVRIDQKESFSLLVGCAPVFFAAYSLFEVLMYGDHTAHFADTQVSSSVTLFVALLGDEIRPTFMELVNVQQVPDIVTGVCSHLPGNMASRQRCREETPDSLLMMDDPQ